MSYPGIELRRDHWLVPLQSISYSNRLDVAYVVEELIERIGHEAVAENLRNRDNW